MNSFELIVEDGRPVAALLSGEIADSQLWIIYSFLPAHSYCQHELAKRWNVHCVICSDDWRQTQLHRRPMLKPKSIKLGFL